ncbi:MAG: ribulose-phosphate 3-epimerase [Candidatus Omnitrophica bacterium]|nr:ribulose-phosphate 3-epimerase [Candidatus Omnitrophota bacterium]
MKKNTEISASVLSADFCHLARDLKRCEDAGVTRFHIDCMDGHFVPNLTIGPPVIESIRQHTTLLLEAHLMIEHPGKYIERYAQAGADIIQLQAECYGERLSSCRLWDQWPKEISELDIPALRADLSTIRKLGKKAFVVFNPGTPLCESILDDCDGVLIMSVNPGFSGQSFMPGVLPKVERLKEIFKGDIAIDGGINAQTSPQALQAGANVLITASYLFGADNISDAVKELKKV